MKRKRRTSKSSFTNTLKDGAMVAGGFIVATVINKKVGFIQSNPTIGVIAPIAGGILLKGAKTGGCALASGMIAAGVVQGVRTYLPALAEQTGIAGLSRSTWNPGVAGRSSLVID